jgi:hypothetical protein
VKAGAIDHFCGVCRDQVLLFLSSSSVEDGNEIMTIGVAGPFFSGFGDDLLVMIWRDVQ